MHRPPRRRQQTSGAGRQAAAPRCGPAGSALVAVVSRVPQAALGGRRARELVPQIHVLAAAVGEQAPARGGDGGRRGWGLEGSAAGLGARLGHGVLPGGPQLAWAPAASPWLLHTCSMRCAVLRQRSSVAEHPPEHWGAPTHRMRLGGQPLVPSQAQNSVAEHPPDVVHAQLLQRGTCQVGILQVERRVRACAGSQRGGGGGGRDGRGRQAAAELQQQQPQGCCGAGELRAEQRRLSAATLHVGVGRCRGRAHP